MSKEARFACSLKSVLFAVCVLSLSLSSVAFADDVPFSSLEGKWIISKGEAEAKTSDGKTATATLHETTIEIKVIKELGNNHARLNLFGKGALTLESSVSGFSADKEPFDVGWDGNGIPVTREGNKFKFAEADENDDDVNNWQEPANCEWVLTYDTSNNTISLKFEGKDDEDVLGQIYTYSYNGTINAHRVGGDNGGSSSGGCYTGIGIFGILALALGFAGTRIKKTRR